MAWKSPGWSFAFASEIERFPSAVYAQHHTAPNWGDMTKFQEWPHADIDVLVGGTPCQSFSVAGLRKGLADPRGNLALTFLAILDRYRPRWVLWENVPGVLSSDGGRAFGAFLGGLGQLGYGWNYRVLDAQYFGVPQRRRRVFVVGYLGDWRPPAAVLFERESLQGHPAPRCETGEGVAPSLAARTRGGGGLGTDFDCDGGLIAAYGGNNTEGPIDVATACRAKGGSGHGDFESETFVAHTSPPMTSNPYGDHGLGSDPIHSEDLAQPVTNRNGDPGVGVMNGMAVRRLTPTECERLQGFPDSYTRIPWRGKPAEQCPDGPRYKALGNSMAVPVMRWLGERMDMVDRMLAEVDL